MNFEHYETYTGTINQIMWDIPLDGVWDNLHMDFVATTKMVGEERLLLVGL